MSKTGIYTITNILNNKMYVGYSCHITKRLNTHKSNLRLNKHSNYHLQSSVNQYGLENFKFEILEVRIIYQMVISGKKFKRSLTK